MRIGQFVWFGLGGADKAAENLVRGLIEAGEDPVIFYNEWSFPKPSTQWDPGVKMLSRYDNYSDLEMIEIRNVSELNNHGLDILNTHRAGDDRWALPNFEKTPFNFKVVETNFHGNCSSKADCRVFPSHAMLKKISGKFRVIPNPIMKPLTIDDLRGELDLNGKFVYGKLGRACAEVYSTVNLEAYRSIENNNTCFLYISPCQRARDDASRLGIKNIIFLEQSVDNEYISKVYNTFDVFCHSNNLGETFGNTIAEAMIHGKPVISHIGGSTWPQAQGELLGVTSELYITNDIAAGYANAMQKLQFDVEYYEGVKAKVKFHADRNYDYVEVSKKYIELYSDVMRGAI